MQRLREPGNLVRFHTGEGNLNKHYEVDRTPLGEGRYSRVFGATHRETQARRAIKTADRQGAWTQYVDLGMECPARLASHEAEILRMLDHPNIIRIIEVFEEKKAVHLVLELCEGGDVLERILVSNGRLAEADIARLFIQMLFAVWHLHKNGVVHRDVKPEHFLFTRREPNIEPKPPEQATMKLIDFGLSHKMGMGFAPDGGTPQFMSPEAKTGKVTQECADRSDMWSLGVVLHAMLVGHYPSPHLSDEKQKQYFSRSAWSQVSAQGIETIGLLLRQEATARPSAADCFQLAWAQAALGAHVKPPQPLLKTLTPAIKSYGGANGLRRLALAVVAREVNDEDIGGLRQLLQSLELQCGGSLDKGALQRAQSAAGIVGDAATGIFRAFDNIVEKGVEKLSWSEMVALFLCGSKGVSGPVSNEFNNSSVPTFREEACWRAFKFLTPGGIGGIITADSLEQLCLSPKGGGEQKVKANATPTTSAALNSSINAVSSSGSILFQDFMKLATGELQRGLSLGPLMGIFRCGSKTQSNNEPPPLPTCAAPLMAPPSSTAGPSRSHSPQVLNSERGAPPSPAPGKEKKKKRSPLSILGMTSL